MENEDINPETGEPWTQPVENVSTPAPAFSPENAAEFVPHPEQESEEVSDEVEVESKGKGRNS